MTVDQYLAAAKVPGPSRQRREEAIDIAPVDIRRILEMCGREADAISARDMALVALLYGSGLSSNDIVKLDLGDLDVEARCLTVNLKSSKDVYAVEDIYDWLDPWIQIRIQEATASPLFVAVDKAGRLLERRLAPQVVHDVLIKRAKQTGLGRLTVAATRRLAYRERLRLKLDGRPDRDDRERIYCLPVPH
jgi:site-specific recombinase XerC